MNTIFKVKEYEQVAELFNDGDFLRCSLYLKGMADTLLMHKKYETYYPEGSILTSVSFKETIQRLKENDNTVAPLHITRLLHSINQIDNKLSNITEPKEPQEININSKSNKMKTNSNNVKATTVKYADKGLSALFGTAHFAFTAGAILTSEIEASLRHGLTKRPKDEIRRERAQATVSKIEDIIVLKERVKDEWEKAKKELSELKETKSYQKFQRMNPEITSTVKETYVNN